MNQLIRIETVEFVITIVKRRGAPAPCQPCLTRWGSIEIRKRRQSESPQPHPSGKRSPSDLLDRSQLSLNSATVSPIDHPSLPELSLLSQSLLTIQPSLPILPSSNGQPACSTSNESSEPVPILNHSATNIHHPNFEGFESSCPNQPYHQYHDDSDSDSVITAGQRNSADIEEHPLSMHNPIILVEPVPQHDSGDTQLDVTRFLSNDLALSKALANSIWEDWHCKHVKEYCSKSTSYCHEIFR